LDAAIIVNVLMLHTKNFSKLLVALCASRATARVERVLSLLQAANFAL
jgi:hypothetical protein